MGRGHSIWSDESEFEREDLDWAADRSTRPAPRRQDRSDAVEIDRGTTGGLYHFHHGAEELLVVLRGTPTLRTPDGARELEEGEVVHFAVGPEGAHQLVNRSTAPVRYLMVANRPSPEAVEYPDSNQLSVLEFTDSQLGGPLWDIRTLEAPSDPS